MDAVPADEPIEFRVQAEGDVNDVRVTRGPCAGVDGPVIGILLVDSFPFGITIDGQTTQDGTVTVRDRDTLKQERIASDQLVGYLAEKLKA